MAPGSPNASMTYSRKSSRTPSPSHCARDSRCCNPSGLASPRCSAIVQQFLRSSPETIPSINSLAWRKGYNGQIAARSGRSSTSTRTTTDQGLRYEPRRPRHIQMCSQTPNNAAVTASTSADTPETPNPELGGAGAGAVANGSAVGLGLLPEFPRGQLSLQPWPVSLPFPAPARQTVHAVVGLEI